MKSCPLAFLRSLQVPRLSHLAPSSRRSRNILPPLDGHSTELSNSTEPPPQQKRGKGEGKKSPLAGRTRGGSLVRRRSNPRMLRRWPTLLAFVSILAACGRAAAAGLPIRGTRLAEPFDDDVPDGPGVLGDTIPEPNTIHMDVSSAMVTIPRLYLFVFVFTYPGHEADSS